VWHFDIQGFLLDGIDGCMDSIPASGPTSSEKCTTLLDE